MLPHGGQVPPRPPAGKFSSKFHCLSQGTVVLKKKM